VLSRADDLVELRPTAAPYTVQRNAEAPALPSETGQRPRRKVMTDLPKRELGRTGLRVTMLGCGAMELRGAPRARLTTDERGETILNAVLDAGINYIDTSIDYGVSEERIGRYISHRRTEYHPNPAHLQDNVAILQKGPLPAELYAEAKRRPADAGSVPAGA
jgi:hypothetical protein